MGIMVGSGNSISVVRMAGAVVVVFIVVNQLVVISCTDGPNYYIVVIDYTVGPNYYTTGGNY